MSYTEIGGVPYEAGCGKALRKAIDNQEFRQLVARIMIHDIRHYDIPVGKRFLTWIEATYGITIVEFRLAVKHLHGTSAISLVFHKLYLADLLPQLGASNHEN